VLAARQGQSFIRGSQHAKYQERRRENEDGTDPKKQKK